MRKTEEMGINIPAGIDDGQVLTVRGKGNSGINGGPAGDLFVTIQIRPHAIFSRRGNDVMCDVPISFVEAALGAEIEVATIDGKVRDLYPSEMLGQIICATLDTGERISNVVMMGIGEPLDNYDNVIRFLHLVNDERGLNIGLRHISLSTCGVVPNIYKLTDEHLPVTLSVSLHASNDKMRSELMPINRKYKIDELMRACVHYFKSSGRRVSFEYTLIAGDNDNERTALELASLIKRYFRDTAEPVHVNLILVNPVAERAYTRPAQKNAEAFRVTLERQGINATIRRRLGTDIDAACGQLRRTHNSEV